MKLDVLICTKNSDKSYKRIKVLDKCFKSIRNQVPYRKVILVDAFSTDNTIKKAKKYFGKKLKIILTNEKLGKAREIGFKSSKADWIFVVDSDVVLPPKTWEKIKLLTNNYDAIECGTISFTNKIQKVIRRKRGILCATLINKKFLEGINIPNDMEVYEDEFIKRYVTSKGGKWFSANIFVFHYTKDPTPQTMYKIGYFSGKYNLKSFFEVIGGFIKFHNNLYFQQLKGYIRGRLEFLKKSLKIFSYEFLSFLYFRPGGVLDAISFFFDYLLNVLRFLYSLMVRLILGSEKSIKYSLRKGLNNPFVPFSFFASIIVGKEKVKVKIRKNHDDFYLLSPLYEREILHLFKPSSNDVVVDVGAHVGKYTLYASKLAKKGKIIAIEPNKESFKTLIENLKLNNCKNVKAYNVATFDKKCKLKLWVTKDEGRSSVIEKRGNNFEIVTAFSLSHILEDNKIKKVDWMKIDVEGAEIKVLKGAEKFLRKTKNLIVEVQDKNEERVLKILRNHFKKIKIISKERDQKYYLARN